MKDNFFKKVKYEMTFEKVIVRIVMAWLITALLFFVKEDISFDTVEYAYDINFPMYICYMIMFFVSFCALGYFKVFGWVETYGPMILITIYGALTVETHSTPEYIAAICVFLGVSILYAVNRMNTFYEIRRKSTTIAVYVVCGLFFAGFFGSIMALKYASYYSPAFDFGIWVQMFHNMRTSFLPYTTVERSKLMSHFAVHFSPIYYVFLPIYFIFPKGETLQILQNVFLATGLIPVFLLCRTKKLSNGATSVFAVIFVLFPALACGCFYDLHENCMLVPLLLWLFYFIEKDNLKGIIVFTILTLLVKEDAAMYVFFVGLFIIMEKKKYVKGSIVLLVSIAYFIVVTTMINCFGKGIMSNRYDNYLMSGDDAGLISVVKYWIANPALLVANCFKTEKLQYLLYMFLPLGFMPFATKKMPRYILFLPMIIINLATDYKYQYSIFFQYVFGVLAILFYLAIINYADLSEKARHFMCSLALCAAIVIMPVTSMTKNHYFEYYSSNYDNIKKLDAMVESIPKDASVMTTTFFLPHLANRSEIYEYPQIYKTDVLSDYVILDLRSGKISDEEIQDFLEMGYEIKDFQKSLYMVLKKTNTKNN